MKYLIRNNEKGYLCDDEDTGYSYDHEISDSTVIFDTEDWARKNCSGIDVVVPLPKQRLTAMLAKEITQYEQM